MPTNSPCTTRSWRTRVIRVLRPLPATLLSALLLTATPAWARQPMPTTATNLHVMPRMAEQVSLTILGSNRLTGVQRGPSAVSSTLEMLCADARSLPYRFAPDADTELWLSSTSAGPVMLRLRYDNARRLQRLDVVPHDQEAFDRHFASDLGVRRSSLATERNRRTVLSLQTGHSALHAVGATVQDAWVVTAERAGAPPMLMYYRFDHSGRVTETRQLRAAPLAQIALLLDNP